MTSPSIYLHFADKEALFDAVCAKYFQRMINDGIYPRWDPNRMAFDLWTVVHGVAALFIAKPYWLLDDVEELADKVLRAMCCGQIAAGIVGYDMSTNDTIDHLLRLKSSGESLPNVPYRSKNRQFL